MHGNKLSAIRNIALIAALAASASACSVQLRWGDSGDDAPMGNLEPGELPGDEPGNPSKPGDGPGSDPASELDPDCDPDTDADCRCIASIGIELPLERLPARVTVPVGAHGVLADGSVIALGPDHAGLDWNTAHDAISDDWRLNTGVFGTSVADVSLSAGREAGTCGGASLKDDVRFDIDHAAMVSGLGLSPSSHTVGYGATAELSAVASFVGYDGVFEVTPFADWGASPMLAGMSHAASQDGRSEVFTAGTAPGTTTVTARYDDAVGTAELIVTGAPITSVTITDAAIGSDAGLLGRPMPGGVEIALTAEVEYGDGTVLVNPPGLRFHSDDDSVLRSEYGSYSATTAFVGETERPRVRASYGGTWSASVPVEIRPGAFESLAFESDEVRLARNSSKPFAVRGGWGGEMYWQYDVSHEVACTSSAPAEVSVFRDDSGLALRAGDAESSNAGVTVTCSRDGVTSSFLVFVDDICMTGVELREAAMPDGALELVAVGTYSDGSTTTNITGPGTWTSSDGAVLSDAGPTVDKHRRFAVGEPGTSTVDFEWTSTHVCVGGDASDNTVRGQLVVEVTPDGGVDRPE